MGLLVVIGYLLAAGLGAEIAVNRDFHDQPNGIAVWVACSDIHTDIVVPLKNPAFDWSSLLSDDVRQADWLVVGWGDRRFYLETPTWADVRVSTVLGAACGIHATAMHVEWLSGELREGPRCRRVLLDREQYLNLCAFLRNGFKIGAPPRALRIPSPGYGSNDAFYEARGHYSVFETCNTWAGQALAAAGVRVGAWTPMTWGVLHQLSVRDVVGANPAPPPLPSGYHLSARSLEKGAESQLGLHKD